MCMRCLSAVRGRRARGLCTILLSSHAMSMCEFMCMSLYKYMYNIIDENIQLRPHLDRPLPRTLSSMAST